ncbi:MAG: ANTAR domain-containing protein [Acidimicrobiia bacterium]
MTFPVCYRPEDLAPEDGGSPVSGARPVSTSAWATLRSFSRAFALRDQELASLFATHASAIVTHAAVDASADQISRRLQEALQTRALIAQAQGVLMGRQGITADEAYNILRRFSRATSVQLSERARQVVATAQSTGDV